jgi:hypothetical protein
VILTFLTSVAYDPWSVDHANTGRWFALALIACGSLFAIRARPGLSHWLGASFLVYAALSVAWSPSRYDGVAAVAQLALLGLVFVIGSASSVGAVRGWTVGLGAACVVQGLFLVAQLAGYRPVQVIGGPGGSDLAGLFVDRDVAGALGAVSLVLVLGRRLWWFLPAALVCALLPQSHASYLALVVAGLLWLWPRASLGTRAIGLTSVPVVLGALLIGRSASMAERLDIWRTTVSHLTLFGRGAGSFASLLPASGYAHDEYLQFAFEYGAGSLALAGVLALAVWSGRALREPEWHALVALLVCASLGYTLHAPATAYLVALLAGHLCGERDRVLRSWYDGGTLREIGFGGTRTVPALRLSAAGPSGSHVPVRSRPPSAPGNIRREPASSGQVSRQPEETVV